MGVGPSCERRELVNKRDHECCNCVSVVPLGPNMDGMGLRRAFVPDMRGAP